MGVYILMGGVIGTLIQPNMMRLMDDVHQGTLDFVLTKPEDAQVLVSVREFRIWQVVDASSGIVVLAVAVGQLHGRRRARARRSPSSLRWCSAG